MKHKIVSILQSSNEGNDITIQKIGNNTLKDYAKQQDTSIFLSLMIAR